MCFGIVMNSESAFEVVTFCWKIVTGFGVGLH